MRKIFWCGTLLAIAITGAAYWTGVYAGRHPETLLGQCTEIISRGSFCPRGCADPVPGCEDSDLSPVEEPQAVVDQLPDQPEPIDLFQGGSEAVLAPPASVTALSAPELSLPVADSDEDCYKAMSLCEEHESEQLKLMPYAGDDNLPGLELCFLPFKLFGFIDIAGLIPRNEAKHPVNVPIKEEVQSSLGERPRPTVDTTEFRPTDAKRGQLGKVPF
jgi:hypothetical protein